MAILCTSEVSSFSNSFFLLNIFSMKFRFRIYFSSGGSSFKS